MKSILANMLLAIPLKSNTNGCLFLILRTLNYQSQLRMPNRYLHILFANRRRPRRTRQTTARRPMTLFAMPTGCMYGQNFTQLKSLRIQHKSRSIFRSRIRFGSTLAEPQPRRKHSTLVIWRRSSMTSQRISWRVSNLQPLQHLRQFANPILLHTLRYRDLM